MLPLLLLPFCPVVWNRTKEQLYKFLNDDTKLNAFEKWLYSNLNLEEELGSENYLNLVSFNFKSKYANERLKTLVYGIIDKGDFEEWKITTKLQEFIEKPELTKDLLNEFYRLYCGIPYVNSDTPKGYKFLQNLGLNYFYWIDEAYLKLSYGKKWSEYYKKYEAEIPFYHSQLVPVAKLILSALESKEIEILERGIYKITDRLKEKLEGEKILSLEDHK
ncbi:MAG TPA: hypothetical protein VJ953_18455 [Saprospiraceae bacterium]|nr:hypothetical protein [Saprospiraceae bacterium]